jgi:hypothetical protein
VYSSVTVVLKTVIKVTSHEGSALGDRRKEPLGTIDKPNNVQVHNAHLNHHSLEEYVSFEVYRHALSSNDSIAVFLYLYVLFVATAVDTGVFMDMSCTHFRTCLRKIEAQWKQYLLSSVPKDVKLSLQLLDGCCCDCGRGSCAFFNLAIGRLLRTGTTLQSWCWGCIHTLSC